MLWLSADNEKAKENLKQAAQQNGVDPARLIFAARMQDYADHLARYRLADLFLDTLPYNAHATANDALWAGLPVLTQMGEAFAGRVSASLLHALGMPELIAQSQDEYEQMAISYGSDPSALRHLKDKLAHQSAAAPLFETATYTRNLERAFEMIVQRHRDQLPCDHIMLSYEA